MIDVHSHILPLLDDGASSVEESLNMLKYSKLQGVDTVVATPHCYLKGPDGIDDFLKRRKESYELLKKELEKEPGEYPKLLMACELHIMDSMPDVKSLRPLCIEGTDYILVELPYKKWTVEHYDFLYELSLCSMRPVIAHIDRYKAHKKEFYNLFSLDLVYQVNADAFIRGRIKRFMPFLFERGVIQLLGSDMHNMKERISHIKEAQIAIHKGYGQERLNYLIDNSNSLLNNKEILRIQFEKMGFWDKFKL